jgi:Fe2+ or Zn2+ uptake regulation protein
MSETPDAAIANVLRSRGLRVTPQRRAVWAVLAGADVGHVTAEEVLRRARRVLPEIARGTTYSTLSEFVAAGLLGTVSGGPSLLYDTNVEPHGHFRCLDCARLYDVHPTGLDRIRPAEPGFSVERTDVLFEGVCPTCGA